MTNSIVNTTLDVVLDLQVIDDIDVALAVLDPLRATMLTALSEPGSASSLASTLGQPRQKLNYHLRTLESLGLVHLVEERPRRGLTERLLQASARGYVLSPSVLGAMAADPDRLDRLSTAYLLASASRLIAEVGELAISAEAAGQQLPTLTIDTSIRFGSAESRAAFTEELASAVADLAARHHDEVAPSGRWHRMLVAAHPTSPPSTREDRP